MCRDEDLLTDTYYRFVTKMGLRRYGFPSESDSESEDSCSQAYEDVIDSRGAQKQSTASAMTSRTTGSTSLVGTPTQAPARIPLVDAWPDLGNHPIDDIILSPLDFEVFEPSA